MLQVFRLWPTPPGPTVMKARTMLTPRSVKHIAASWHSKAATVSKKVGAEEFQEFILVSGHDRVAGGVWCGEVHVVIRVRHHGTDVPLDFVEQPAPTGGGETRLPDPRGVAPFTEVPDGTFPAKVILQFARTIGDGLHHLHSPRGPRGWPVVSPIPREFRGGGGRTEVLGSLRIQYGVVLHPSRHPESHEGSSHGLTWWRPTQFTEADDEKTPSKVRQENPWQVKSTPLWPVCASPLREPRRRSPPRLACNPMVSGCTRRARKMRAA